MMIYLCDSAVRRDWDAMLPQPWSRVRWHIPLKPNRSPNFLSEDSDAAPEAGAIIVLHPEPEPATLERMGRLADERGWLIITISGGDRHGILQPLSPRVYRRQRAVCTGLDRGFQRCLARFLTVCDPSAAEPAFESLEPSPWPRHVVALYLLVIAQVQGMALDTALAKEALNTLLGEAHDGWLERDTETAWEALNLDHGWSEEVRQGLEAGLARMLPEAKPGHIVLVGSAPEEASQRGQLRHSWLENLVLGRSHDFVARLHATDSVARQAFTQRLEPDGVFARHLSTARRLAQHAPDAFCASRLVREEPLVSLLESPQLANDVAQAVHEASRRAHAWEEMSARVVEASERVEHALEAFVAVWNQHPPATGEVVSSAFLAVQEEAQTLHGALGGLPAGVILP